jgi:hypothetical protein
MTSSKLMRTGDGSVESSEGWVARLLNPEMIEYCSGSAACLVNVGYSPTQRARQIYATESTSELFPRLREHMRRAAPLFEGHYVVV